MRDRARGLALAFALGMAWVAGAGREDLAAWRSLARSRYADASTVAAAEARCRVLDQRFGA